MGRVIRIIPCVSFICIFNCVFQHIIYQAISCTKFGNDPLTLKIRLKWGQTIEADYPYFFPFIKLNPPIFLCFTVFWVYQRNNVFLGLT